MWLEHKAGGPAVDDREQEDVSGHLWVKVGKINCLSFSFSTWVYGLCSLPTSMNSIPSELIVYEFGSLLDCDQFESDAHF